ncbi:hypothetical protein AOLI_G00260140 [Acnodon oligacanthus]
MEAGSSISTLTLLEGEKERGFISAGGVYLDINARPPHDRSEFIHLPGHIASILCFCGEEEKLRAARLF